MSADWRSSKPGQHSLTDFRPPPGREPTAGGCGGIARTGDVAYRVLLKAGGVGDRNTAFQETT